jgi:hypothetical protein
MPYVFLVPIAVVLAGVFIFFEVRNRPLFAFWFKGLASFAFIVLAVASVWIAAHPGIDSVRFVSGFFLCIVLGLVAGLVGDLFLALRSLRPREEDHRLIIGGTIAFAIGQIFYFNAMVWTFGLSSIAIIVALVAVLLVAVGAWRMKMDWGGCRIPCLVYTFLVFLVAGHGVYAFIVRNGDAVSTLLMMGGILFTLSDLVLSQIYFAGRNGKGYVLVNLVTYYAAQICLASALYFMI